MFSAAATSLLSNAQCAVVDGTVYASFEMPCNSGFNSSIGNGFAPQYLIDVSGSGYTNVAWAVGKSAFFDVHAWAQITQVNFVSGDAHALPIPAIRLAHSSLMFVAWGVMLPLGVAIARFTKHFAAPVVVSSRT